MNILLLLLGIIFLGSLAAAQEAQNFNCPGTAFVTAIGVSYGYIQEADQRMYISSVRVQCSDNGPFFVVGNGANTKIKPETIKYDVLPTATDGIREIGACVEPQNQYLKGIGYNNRIGGSARGCIAKMFSSPKRCRITGFSFVPQNYDDSAVSGRISRVRPTFEAC
jgi:hypothetical protein